MPFDHSTMVQSWTLPLQGAPRSSRAFSDHLIDGSRSVGPFSKSECEQLLGVLYRDKGESNVTGVASASEYRSLNVVQRIWASLNLPQSAFSPGS